MFKVAGMRLPNMHLFGKDSRLSTKTNQFRSLIAASGQAPVAQPTTATTLTASAKTKRIGKRTAPDYVQVGVYIPRKLHTQAKVLLINEEPDRDFSQLIGDLLSDYLMKRVSAEPPSRLTA